MCYNSRVSALNGIAFACLILSALACALSYCAPFWLYYPSMFGSTPASQIMIPNASKSYPFNKASYRGVWAACYRTNSCVWFWSDNFAPEKTLPAWYISVQCVFGVGVVLFLVAIIIQSVYACCRCCSRSSPCPTVVASFTVAAGLLVAAALSVYGGFSYHEGEFTINVLRDSQGAQLDWSFYVGIAGSGAAILTAILFYADGCRIVSHYGGYSRPPTVKTS